MLSNRNVIVVALEAVLLLFVAGCLWYKFLLPTSYFVAVALLIALLVIQMVRSHDSRFLVFQIALLFLFARNIYYLATNYSIIPFNDGNWDYGVVKTFMEKGSIFVIQEPNLPLFVNFLPWYSGWPLLHTIAMSLSLVSGIDAFYLALLLPSFIGMSSFVFVYLFVEKMRKSIGIDARVTPLALLIYATSAESLVWSMQFVRQNLGMLLFTITLYIISLLVTNPYSVKCKVLAIFFAMSLVMAHHFTSLIMVVYFSLFFVISKIGKYPAKTMRVNLSTIGIALITFAFLFVWWDNFGSIIWPTVGSSVERFVGVLIGAKEITFLPKGAYYPSILRPPLVLSLLTIRDLLTYVPAFFGLLLVMIKTRKTAAKSFVVYSGLTFGTIFIIDNFFFRVEIFRIPSLALPFVVLLSAFSFTQLTKSLGHIWKSSVIVLIVTILLLSMFTGLWGHNFAPLHLYDPHINYMDVGERNPNFMRVSDFLNRKLSINKYQRIWADDLSPLSRLLDPNDYNKIERLTQDSIHTLDLNGNDLVCAFKDLNLYSYYRGAFSEKPPQETEVFRYELHKYLGDKFNRIYDDGEFAFWISGS